MIFDILLSVPIYLLNTILGILPTASATNLSFITSNLTTFWDFIDQGAALFPVTQLFFAVSIIVTIEVAMLSYKLIYLFIVNISLGILKK